MTRGADANLTNVSPLCDKAVLVDADNIAKRWTMPVQNWKPVLNRFTTQFGERMPTNEHSPRLHKIRDTLEWTSLWSSDYFTLTVVQNTKKSPHLWAFFNYSIRNTDLFRNQIANQQ